MWSLWRTVVVCLVCVVVVVCGQEEEGNNVCSVTSFRCLEPGKCIPKSWECDGVPDCPDASDEDPASCPEQTCKQLEFQCGDGKCIPLRWQCDSEFDCDDHSDEDPKLCDELECKPDEFTCHNTANKSNCIPLNWVCDGTYDCDDRSDEVSCNATCTSEQFTCASGKCISKRWQCDGDSDCGEEDFSDEANCPPVSCTFSQIACPDGSCINKSHVCDGKADCQDGSDEHDCPPNPCKADEYSCAGGFQCIRRDWLCDGDKDCPNDDDESKETCKQHCGQGFFTCKDQSCIPENLKCNGFTECADASDEIECEQTCNETFEFNCGDHCIPMELVCNNIDDCGNGHDEPSDDTCGKDECQVLNGGCTHICVNTPASHYCRCKSGYMLVNNTQCEDINECLEPGLCSQVCDNYKGGFKCECVGGYARDPNNPHGCKAMEGHASLLFAHFTDIRKISLDHQEVRQITAIVNETNGATALDFVFKTGMIFWTDVRDRCIYKAPIDEGSKKVVVVSDDVTTVDGLAVDWLYNHIYWTNTDKNTIEVADFKGEMRKTLFRAELDEPRAIAVYPSEGWMFWTDWGQEAKIERAGMDGKSRQVIVSRDIRWPNALTLDLVLRKIYWSDSKYHSIYSCDFDGTNRRIVLHSMEHLPHPFSITVFEDTMYWTDWRREAILRANKFTGKDVQVVVPSHATPMTVHVYHSYRQPNGTNHCTPLNGLCTHLCLPAPQTSPTASKITCACPDGLSLMSDGLTCESEEVMSSTELPEDGPSMDSGAPGSQSGDDEGSVAVAAILGALGVLCVASALAYVLYRYFRKRSVHGMNFDNPVYKKTTTEDGFHLAGQQQQQRNNCPRPAPSQSQFQHRQYGVMSPEDSLEPLTNGSNNFV